MSSDDQNFAEANEGSDDDDENQKRIQTLKKEAASAAEGGNSNAPSDVASLHMGSSRQEFGAFETTTGALASDTPETSTEEITEESASRSAIADDVRSTKAEAETSTLQAEQRENGRPMNSVDGVSSEPQNQNTSRTSAGDAATLENIVVDGSRLAQGQEQTPAQDSIVVEGSLASPDGDQAPDQAPDTVDENQAPIDIAIGQQFASGREQQANSHDSGHQSAPAIAALDDGGYSSLGHRRVRTVPAMAFTDSVMTVPAMRSAMSFKRTATPPATKTRLPSQPFPMVVMW